MKAQIITAKKMGKVTAIQFWIISKKEKKVTSPLA